jgi:hypothetical protein
VARRKVFTFMAKPILQQAFVDAGRRPYSGEPPNMPNLRIPGR